MTDKFKNVWRDGPDIFDEVKDEAGSRPKRNFLYEDISLVTRHLSPEGTVWVRLLQLWRMRKRGEKYIVLAQAWLTEHGVDRYAKYRALRKFEKDGDIRVVRSDHRGPRVALVPVRRRHKT